VLRVPSTRGDGTDLGGEVYSTLYRIVKAERQAPDTRARPASYFYRRRHPAKKMGLVDRAGRSVGRCFRIVGGRHALTTLEARAGGKP
jgi:hypothetical protein